MLGQPCQKSLRSSIKVVFQLKGLVSSGMDGLPTCFYHHYWDVLGKDIINHILNILSNHGNVVHINQTYICLVLKKSNTLIPTNFHLISLCNVILKMVTKTIANRIKPYLDNMVNANQSAFILNILINDNIILAYESFHSLCKNSLCKNKSKNNGYVDIKLDMTKAYDRL